MTSLPSPSRIFTGAIETSVNRWSFVSRNAMPPSSPTRGTRLESIRQRHVLVPWRSRTVRNCSSVGPSTRIVSAPTEVGRETPLAKRCQSPGSEPCASSVTVALLLRTRKVSSPMASSTPGAGWRTRGACESEEPSAFCRNDGGPSERPGVPSCMTATKIAAASAASAARRTGDALRRTATLSASAERSPGRSSERFAIGFPSSRRLHRRAIPGLQIVRLRG